MDIPLMPTKRTFSLTTPSFDEPWFDEDGQTYWVTFRTEFNPRFNLVAAVSPEEAQKECPLLRGASMSQVDMFSVEEWEARGFRRKASWEKYHKDQAKAADAQAAVYKAALADLTALVEALRVELRAVHADVKALRGGDMATAALVETPQETAMVCTCAPPPPCEEEE